MPALPNGARVLPSTVTALPRAVAVCPMAPAPLLPLRSTPVHCDTTHSAFETLLAYVMVIGPLPGAALMARNTTRRATGAVTASMMLATCVQVAIPPPVTVGVRGPPLRRLRTATVIRAFGAGEMDAVVYARWFPLLLPDVRSVCVMVLVATPPPSGGVTVTEAVCVMGVPSIVADTSLPSATLEVRMLVKTPLPSVVPEVVRVLPLPDAAMVTPTPLTGSRCRPSR